VELGTADRTFTFIVSSIRIVNPKDTWVLASGRESMLTLLTCYPFGYVGPAPQRMVVQATLMPDSPDLPNENQYQGAVAVEEDANCM
jgi:sortase A